MAVERDKHHDHGHGHGHGHDQRAKQDDLLWTTRQALQQRAMPMPKSAVGNILDKRFATLFSSLRSEKRDGAKSESSGGEREGEGAQLAGRTSEDAPQLKPADAPRTTGLEESPAMAAPAMAPLEVTTSIDAPQFVAASDDAPQFRDPVSQQSGTQPGQEVLRAPEVAPPSWVWVASQALGANLKRLGFEPSELDDIRVSLIRVLAAEFPKLKLLTKLPSSLSPSAPEKVIDDIRVMALAHMMNELLAKSVKDLEKEQEEKEKAAEEKQVEEQQEEVNTQQEEDSQKHNFEIPRSVSNRYKDIPAIIFDPTDVTAT